ncbi:carbohydrate kinase family protein [Hathewaya limosa]|uniref:Sugar/nucleoside kinase (Ribokinase family) n=1 Tax=Hathewaya limosa TaxID=1536 RepID=A0ABU0JTH9_HATLI|nr:carbohydrate kinase family protein [Hathewaya limosa]MDQ0480406.1 sugar/nucleoside kinase (ribokinase family) [Hathewaya limosa]
MINKQEPYVVVLGASIVDIFGFCTKKYMQCNSTPGCVKTSLGGVCRNIAENMARIGVKNKFISVLGDDNNGRELLRHSREVGYDMEDSLIVKGYSTPTYMAILDEQGEMVSAVVDMKSIDKLNKKFIDSKAHIIESAEYTFLDSDNPEILQYILEKFKGKTKFVLDPVSACKAKGVRHLVKYFHTIKPNRYEAEMLSGIKINNEEDLNKTVKYFHDLGVENVFISLDADGIFFSNGKEKGKFRANDVVVKNVTGAGDAFVAGIAYGYMNNLSIDDTVTYAITLASIAISHEDTIHPEVNHEFVMEYMNKLQWEKIKY